MPTTSDVEHDQRPGLPYTVIALVVLLAFLGVSGVAGGLALLADVITLPLEWLEGSPFDSYVVPGLSLFTFLGVLPLAVAFGLYRRKQWAWPGVMAVGIAVFVWFAVQASVVGWGNALQWFYLAVGVGILLFAVLPSVRGYMNASVVRRRLTRDR